MIKILHFSALSRGKRTRKVSNSIPAKEGIVSGLTVFSGAIGMPT